ncbi:uncharacterized protein Fot_09479 [Forsythia ovata]|uniref:Uncharacterized protein n=1 Tax=Forsythia ovata TaxID=205694 RepID=A0ABD1WE48_9LAMI
MENILPQETLLLNLTDKLVEFEASQRNCRLPSLMPGGKGQVMLWKILNIMRKYESEELLFKVLMDKEFTGLVLNSEHFLRHVKIVFRIQRDQNGIFVAIAQGIKETEIDIILRIGFVTFVL